VHIARLATIAGNAVDRFELTDRNGRKLDGAMEATVVRAIREGVRRRRLPSLRR
jgi:hypothetical protein